MPKSEPKADVVDLTGDDEEPGSSAPAKITPKKTRIRSALEKKGSRGTARSQEIYFLRIINLIILPHGVKHVPVRRTAVWCRLLFKTHDSC